MLLSKLKPQHLCSSCALEIENKFGVRRPIITEVYAGDNPDSGQPLDYKYKKIEDLEQVEGDPETYEDCSEVLFRYEVVKGERTED